MKKLLFIGLIINSLFAINAYSQPTIQNRQIPGPTWDGVHLPGLATMSFLHVAQGGNPPYTFTLFGQPQNMNIIIQPNGQYIFTINGYPASFQFISISSQGASSAPATITFVPGPLLHQQTEGPEKG